MDAVRVEKIKKLWSNIHGDYVPTFYWKFHPNMYYWYNEITDSIECDCGLSMPITLKDEELNECNLHELIRKIESNIYRDYLNMGWDIGYPED